MGADAFGAGGGEFCEDGGEPCFSGGIEGLGVFGETEDVEAFEGIRVAVVEEVAHGGDTEHGGGPVCVVGACGGAEVFERPAMEFTFVAFAVGVFCGIPAAVLVGHVALDVAGDAAGGVHEGGVAASESGVEVEFEELGVVVEHFFEMRDEPLGVDGVTGEAAADVVADAACGHAAAG